MTSKEKNKEMLEIKKQRLKEHQEEASIVRKIVTICLLVLLVAFSIVGIYAYQYVKGSLEPINESDEELIDIHIPIGSSSTKIGAILEEMA
ncbi:hypothetical protein KHA80_04405 [Anaerobacillus sp. HL2]|nr:hypothetical protein KHA80_04405 [Anaerobacillus sp. HL2]